MIMRSTRATAAVVRLNSRSPDREYGMAQTGAGLFYLNERVDGTYLRVTDDLNLDDFVRAVNAMGTQEVRKMTKNDAAFAKQLAKKN
jgi:hypothetical protein